MKIGEQVVACMGIRKHEGIKCLAKNAVNPRPCGWGAVTKGESKWGKVR
ncbi:hypothetical protein [Providencia manganoxydans]